MNPADSLGVAAAARPIVSGTVVSGTVDAGTVAAGTVAAGTVGAGTVAAGTVAPDTVAADTVVTAFVPGIVLEPQPEGPRPDTYTPQGTGMSVILTVLAVLFCIIGLRFRNNRKYIAAIGRNLVETRLRHNAFDETVRETSFLLLLDLLWCASAGMLVWGLLTVTGGASPYGGQPLALPCLESRRALSMSLCMAAAAGYFVFMSAAYVMTGTVFADAARARMWLKGFTTSQALQGLLYLPLALMLLFYPGWTEEILYCALALFIIAKSVFIWKGFRIFFNQFSSWVLFLYYLCSLELVPLVLAYLGAAALCSTV